MARRVKGEYHFPSGLSLQGYYVSDSDNVEYVGWIGDDLYVQFKGNDWYLYE
jgi:hypothetical protein